MNKQLPDEDEVLYLVRYQDQALYKSSVAEATKLVSYLLENGISVTVTPIVK